MAGRETGQSLAVGSQRPSFDVNFDEFEVDVDVPDDETESTISESMTENYKGHLWNNFCFVAEVLTFSCVCLNVVIFLMLTAFFSNVGEVQFRGVEGWHVLMFLSLGICLGPVFVCYHCLRILSPYRFSRKEMGGNCAILFVFFLAFACVLELLLWKILPAESFLPLEPLNSDALSRAKGVPYRPSGCNISTSFDQAKRFFSNSTLDLSSTKIIYGGAAGPFRDIIVFDNAIYLEKNSCPEELEIWMIYYATILWQFQKGLWFDSFGKKFWNFAFSQEHSSDLDVALVDQAYAEGWGIENFEFRQQAEIIRRYYISITYNSGNNKSIPVSVKHFARQVLQDGT